MTIVSKMQLNHDYTQYLYTLALHETVKVKVTSKALEKKKMSVGWTGLITHVEGGSNQFSW